MNKPYDWEAEGDFAPVSKPHLSLVAPEDEVPVEIQTWEAEGGRPID